MAPNGVPPLRGAALRAALRIAEVEHLARRREPGLIASCADALHEWSLTADRDARAAGGVPAIAAAELDRLAGGPPTAAAVAALYRAAQEPAAAEAMRQFDEALAGLLGDEPDGTELRRWREEFSGLPPAPPPPRLPPPGSDIQGLGLAELDPAALGKWLEEVTGQLAAAVDRVARMMPVPAGLRGWAAGEAIGFRSDQDRRLRLLLRPLYLARGCSRRSPVTFLRMPTVGSSPMNRPGTRGSGSSPGRRGRSSSRSYRCGRTSWMWKGLSCRSSGSWHGSGYGTRSPRCAPGGESPG
jgi:hypothetical protein